MLLNMKCFKAPISESFLPFYLITSFVSTLHHNDLMHINDVKNFHLMNNKLGHVPSLYLPTCSLKMQ